MLFLRRGMPLDPLMMMGEDGPPSVIFDLLLRLTSCETNGSTCDVSAEIMRPRMPLAAPFWQSRFLAARCIMLCANSEGGYFEVFFRCMNSSAVIGYASPPMFAIAAMSPAFHIACMFFIFGCRAKVPHGCFTPFFTSIGSISAFLIAAFVRTLMYSACKSPVPLPSLAPLTPQLEWGISMLNESAPPGMNTTTTALKGRSSETGGGGATRREPPAPSTRSPLRLVAWNSALIVRNFSICLMPVSRVPTTSWR